MTNRFAPNRVAFIALWLVPACLSAQGSFDRAAETRALVQRLVLERAAALASAQRAADEREEQLFAELAVKDRRLRAEQRTRKEAQTDLATVTAERQRLVDEIATRDRQFAAEIAEYRQQITSIADSPDPRKREALKRYAEGDRTEAFNDLVSIQEELDKANDKASAAGWRELGALALDFKDRGSKDTNAVIQIFENAQRKDSDNAWGWIELRRLYQESGRLPDARRAAEQALEHAQGERDRAVAASELGDVLAAMGDLASARDRFEESLKVSEHLAAANQASTDTQRDLSVGLNRLGDVLVAMGDLAGALSRIEQSLKIAEHLAEVDPSSTIALRDLCASLDRLGGALAAAKDLAGARARFEQSLKITEHLAAANPGSATAQRDLSVSLNKLGAVLIARGDLTGARSRFEQSLRIREQLAQANPSNAKAQRDLSVDLVRIGDVLLTAGDLAGARTRFEENLKIVGHLAEANPSSAETRKDLIISHVTLGALPGGECHWEEALRIALDLQKQGRLAPSDAWMIDDLQKHASTKKCKP